MGRGPSRQEAEAAVRGNQNAADRLREQGRTKDAAAAQAAADHWQQVAHTGGS